MLKVSVTQVYFQLNNRWWELVNILEEENYFDNSFTHFHSHDLVISQDKAL